MTVESAQDPLCFEAERLLVPKPRQDLVFLRLLQEVLDNSLPVSQLDLESVGSS